MGFSKKSKTIEREPISGLFQHNDVPDGEHSVNELRARNESRQEQINSAHKADWSDPNTVNSPAYGNAMSRMPKPSDAVVGSPDTYGGGQTAPPKKGGPPQKPVASPGIQPASKSRA